MPILTRRASGLILRILLVSAWISSAVMLSATPGATKIALLSADQASEERLLQLRGKGFTAVALILTETNGDSDRQLARRINNAELELDYWIEIARNPVMADAHPEWMASIQTHQEWRRHFPEFSPISSNYIVKVYPWVPVSYRETLQPHLGRVAQLLAGRPAPRRLFLNDLQAAPSACGCGNSLCRWTTDYGPLKTASRLGSDAAAQFVAAVKNLQHGVEVIPVWTTECEEHDRQDQCGGVGCFRGDCWREWTAQLRSVAVQNETIAALLLYHAFNRDLPVYSQPAGWITSALGFFQQMPLRYQPEGLPARRLLAILQGWDVTPAQIDAQIARATEAGTAGIMVVFTPIDQSWSPRKFVLTDPGNSTK
jgi:hypothetical protein